MDNGKNGKQTTRFFKLNNTLLKKKRQTKKDKNLYRNDSCTSLLDKIVINLIHSIRNCLLVIADDTLQTFVFLTRNNVLWCSKSLFLWMKKGLLKTIALQPIMPILLCLTWNSSARVFLLEHTTYQLLTHAHA